MEWWSRVLCLNSSFLPRSLRLQLIESKESKIQLWLSFPDGWVSSASLSFLNLSRSSKLARVIGLSHSWSFCCLQGESWDLPFAWHGGHGCDGNSSRLEMCLHVRSEHVSKVEGDVKGNSLDVLIAACTNEETVFFHRHYVRQKMTT